MVNDQEFYHQGFRSFVISSTGQGPSKLMLDGRQEDLKAVFNSIPIGSFWLLEYGTQIFYKWRFNKASEEDWLRLKHYMDDRWTAMEEALVFYFSMSLSMKMRTLLSLTFKVTVADFVMRGLLLLLRS